MAQNPDPLLPLTSIKGVTRTLDDWATMFTLAVVFLPSRKEASGFVNVVARIFQTFKDSDVRTTVCVAANPTITRRILGAEADRWMVFCDPDSTFAGSLGLERMPTFVHIRQDTSLVAATQGWSPTEWQKIANGIAKAQHWTAPIVAGKGDPPPMPGWPLAS